MESSQGLHGLNATEHASSQAPLPSNRKWIKVQGDQFCSGDPARRITDNLKSMFDGPWISWKAIPPDSRKRLWERFMQFFQWPKDLEGSVMIAWENTMKKRLSDTLCKEREKAYDRARLAGMEVGDDISVIIPFGPHWIKHEYWKKMIEMWNTDKWKAISKVNQQNKSSQVEGSVGKHTAGSVSFLVTKLKMEESLGWPVRHSEQFLTCDITKKSRDEMNKGVGEPEFITPKAKRLLDEYLKRMCDTYGDVSTQPLGDISIWETVVGGKKKGRLEGCGSTSDPSYIVTGETSNSGHVSSSVPAGVASSDEVLELKQQVQELHEREQRLLKEMEESRKEMEEARKREMEEYRKREEESRKREEETRKVTEERFNQLQEMLLSHFRANPVPPRPPPS